MDFEKRRFYYNRCAADQPLEKEDDRNVDIDRLEGRVRGQIWVEVLASQVQLSDVPVCIMFTGLPGSGKSTELRRLKAMLSTPASGNYLTVLINAQETFDLGAPLDVPDLLATIVHETEKAVLIEENKNPEDALKDGYLSRLWSWLLRTDVEFNKAEYTIPSGPKLTAELKTRPLLRERLRQTIASRLSFFIEEIRRELRLLEQRAQNKGFTGIVVIVDSLEKLHGIAESFDSVLKSAVQIFGQGAPYLQLPVHTIYTVPPALMTRINQIKFMPVLKIRDPGSQTLDINGRKALRLLVQKRIPDADLQEILGPTLESRLNTIFELSGGYPREIVQILRSLIAIPSYPVSQADFDRILAELKASYRMIVPSSTFPWLAKVEKHHFLTIEDDDHRKAADEIISNNGVLYYWNGTPWWGLHPAVRSIPGVEEAIARL
jgi:hypothetical protein